MRDNRSKLVKIAEVSGAILICVVWFLIIVGIGLIQSDVGVCDTPFGLVTCGASGITAEPTP